MRKSRKYVETEKRQVLEEVKLIKNVASVAKKYNIPIGTIHAWKHKTSKNKSQTDLDLIAENKKLIKELENNVLKELLKKLSKFYHKIKCC